RLAEKLVAGSIDGPGLWIGPTAGIASQGPPAEPSGVPAEPSGVPAEPSGVPAEPSGVPAEPSGVPAEPSGVPAEPSGVPAEPGHSSRLVASGQYAIGETASAPVPRADAAIAALVDLAPALA